jgi:hypothetical protein
MLASSQNNIPTELQHTNDFASNTGNRPITQPIKLTYYDEINFDHVAPGYAPCVDGKGQVNSWIWAHGWRLQQQDTVRPVYYWLCKICFKQRKHLAKPIKCSSGTTGVHNHLQRLHSIKRDKPDWITSAKRRMLQLWQQYSSISIAPVQVSSTLTNRRSTSRLFDLDEEEPQESVGNDYEAWCCKPRDRSLIDRPPLDYWTSEAIASTYPRLQRLALTIFSIPAMSDEPERVFSSCGIMIRPHRSSLSPKMIAASQCLPSWSREGLVTYNIFDRMGLDSMDSIQSLHCASHSGQSHCTEIDFTTGGLVKFPKHSNVHANSLRRHSSRRKLQNLI